VYFTSRDKNVYCLDAREGRLLWKYETQGEIPSSPGVRDGRVYIGSMDMNFYCLDAKNGAVIWKFATQGEIYHTNRPLIHKGVVYFSSFDNNLYAVSARDGKLAWKTRISQHGNSYSPIVHKDMLYIPTRDGTLLSMTLDGNIVWKFTKLYVPSIPAIKDDRIYVGFEDQCMYCLDLRGNMLWKFETQGSVWLSVAFHEDKVIFPSWDCNLYCIDDKTQKLIWKFRMEGSPSYVPPANEEFEVNIKRPAGRTTEEGGREKRYDFRFGEDDGASTYKSRITYRVSNQYAAKGRYQKDADEEGL
jgi:outer membrane protein assembly factor BamB